MNDWMDGWIAGWMDASGCRYNPSSLEAGYVGK